MNTTASAAVSAAIFIHLLCTSYDTIDWYKRKGYSGYWDKTMEGAVEKIGNIVKKMVRQNDLKKKN